MDYFAKVGSVKVLVGFGMLGLVIARLLVVVLNVILNDLFAWGYIQLHLCEVLFVDIIELAAIILAVTILAEKYSNFELIL